MKVDKCVLLAVALCAIVLIGEFCTVNTDVHTFGSSAEWNDTEGYVDYSVTTNGSEVYSAILTDNQGYKSTETLKIYAGDYSDSKTVTEKNQDYIDITESLKKRGFDNVGPCNNDSLRTYLNDTKGVQGYGLLVIVNALPYTVYDEKDSNVLLDWIKAGGNLYWYGSMAGRYYYNGNIVEVPDYQKNLFGVNDCINTDIQNSDKKVDNGFTDLYSLKNSRITNGLNYQKISSVRNVLPMGYQIDGYSTITMVENGNGMVCVFSDTFAFNGIDDLAQVIAAKINVHTTILDNQSGQVCRETANGHMGYNAGTDRHLYVYMGGTYTVYGRSY